MSSGILVYEVAMNKKAERGRATREQLVEIATGLFAEHGYDGTSIEAVLRAAEVSRGALYHHFAGKDALFEAVFEAVEADVGRRAMEAYAGTADPVQALAGIDDPVAVLRAVCVSWVALAGDPVVQRIVLIDGPAVLGWRRWRELEEHYALGGTKALMRRVAEAGRIPVRFADPFAHMILAAMNEMAMETARADDPKTAMRDARAAVEELLDRLLPE